MKSRTASLVLAGYLLLCVGLGGSSTSLLFALILQLGAVCLIAWAAISAPRVEHHSPAWACYAILACSLAVVLLQLIPLPPDIWSGLPGRARISESFHLLGMQLAPAPISETPYITVLTLFAVMPAIAVFIVTERLHASARAIAIAIVVAIIMNVFLGALQVAGGPSSWAYFYERHSSGAVGFFANANHTATLLLVGIPFSVALLVTEKSLSSQSRVTRYSLGLAVLILIVVGIVLTGSRAGMALSAALILASMSLVPRLSKWRSTVLGLAVVTLVGAIVVSGATPIGANSPEKSAPIDTRSREIIWHNTSDAILETLPVGTGLGSFEQVYHGYENVDQVTTSYVNHAHNDYLELALELGAPGIALILAFFAWWSFAVWRIWESPASSMFARAASIATAAVLAHSIVDYPLRTSAISTVFAACIGIMVQAQRPKVSTRGDGRQAPRHVKIG